MLVEVVFTLSTIIFNYFMVLEFVFVQMLLSSKLVITLITIKFNFFMFCKFMSSPSMFSLRKITGCECLFLQLISAAHLHKPWSHLKSLCHPFSGTTDFNNLSEH